MPFKHWIGPARGAQRAGRTARFKIVGPRRRRSLGIDNFTGGLFPDTELPWSEPLPLDASHSPLNPFA